MGIGIWLYPMLFQHDGRLQAQVRATIQALNSAGALQGPCPSKESYTAR